MYGLTQRELTGVPNQSPTFADKLAARDPSAFALPTPRPDLRDDVGMAVRGGFPTAVLDVPPHHVSTWINSCVEQLLTRDAASAVGQADPGKIESYFRAVAANSAGLPEHTTLCRLSGSPRDRRRHRTRR